MMIMDKKMVQLLKSSPQQEEKVMKTEYTGLNAKLGGRSRQGTIGFICAKNHSFHLNKELMDVK